MSYSQLILRDSAEIVWPLDDITESSSVSKAINFISDNPYQYSASININNTNLMNNPIVFGGGTLLSFTSSGVGLSIPVLGRFSELYSNKDSTMSFWFQTNSLNIEESPIFKKRGHQNIGLFIKDNYLIFRYGTSASYLEVSADIPDPKEPMHIVVSKNPKALNMMINGIQFSSRESMIDIGADNQFNDNDYIDFYGPLNGLWNIDSIAIYPNSIDTNVAKRHYVYGLGKNVSDEIFYSRGGVLYNMSTIPTEKILDINWDYKDEWKIKDLIDLTIENDGIQPIPYAAPTLYSFDNYIDKSLDSISFKLSGSYTQASFIEINKLYNKIGAGEYPLFLKIKLDGKLPNEYISQRLLTYGSLPDNEILKFNLYNDGGSYKIKIDALGSSSAVTFDVSNITASPSLYLGMKFDGNTTLYFCEDGESIQSASFLYLNEVESGLDPLTSYMPPSLDTMLRIGSSLNYYTNSFTDVVYGVEQFYGTVERFFVAQTDFSASSNYSYLENYKKSRYEFVYNTSLNRFKVKTFGYGNFNIHSAAFAQYINDSTEKIGANFVKFGYPDIESSSQVLIYVTHAKYDGTILQNKINIKQSTHLDFINNINVAQSYLKFDFEIYSDDCTHYPPKIKYFNMQTFRSVDNKTIMRDDAGTQFVLNPSGSVTYLPEIRYTPTIFMTEDSGIKLLNTVADFSETILSKPLDPRIIPGLKLWLDSRFVNGLQKVDPEDDQRIEKWIDLSDNNNHGVQNILSYSPIFRGQSKNILRTNQLNGSDSGDLSFINPFNCSVISSIDSSINGDGGLRLTPNGLSADSYVDVSFNTASISTFPSQQYVVVGSIKLDKPQTASSLHQNARKIIIYNTDGITETLAASSFAATNLKGIYSLSAIFTTNSNTTMSYFRFYNGSADSRDPVSWDNLGVYPIDSASPTSTWSIPLTSNDRPTLKFNGSDMFLSVSASISNLNSLYVVSRNFGDSIILQSNTASILYSNSSSYFASYGSPQAFYLNNNKFNIFSILNSGTSASIFINGEFTGSYSIGTLNIDELIIGRSLKGDISAVVLYDYINSEKDRKRIEEWLKESFFIN